MFKTSIVHSLPSGERWDTIKTYSAHQPTGHKWTIEDYKFKVLEDDLYIKPVCSAEYMQSLPPEKQSVMEKTAVVKRWKSQGLEDLIEFVCGYNGHWNRPLETTLRYFANDEELRIAREQLATL